MIRELLMMIGKDIKLLLRSRSSTLAVVLGPLLVVLLVGLVFSHGGGTQLTVGVVSGNASVDGYVQSLKDAFTVTSFTDAKTCADAVRQGMIVSCVAFSPGTPPQARIYVDPSDVNVVYSVIDRVTGQLENRSSTVRESLTGQLLGAVANASGSLKTDSDNLQSASVVLQNQATQASSLSHDLMGLQLSVQLVSRAQVSDAIDQTQKARDDYKALATQVLADYSAAATSDNSSSMQSNVNAYETQLSTIENRSTTSADTTFSTLLSGLDSLQTQVQQSQKRAQALSLQAEQVGNGVSSASDTVDAVLSSVDATHQRLSSLGVTQQDITHPIVPVLEPVVSQQSRFAFAFPSFLALIIMFTAVLLASTVIVRERRSSAYFRNFTTPTPPWLFVVATYVTTLIVLALQLFIIFLAATLFSIAFPAAIGTTILALLLAVTFFSLLGMLLGYIFRNQEGVMLAAIAVSSVLLFVSGLVLPVSTLPSAVQFIIKANPFVLSSELLKGALVFSFGLGAVGSYLVVLLLYCVALFALIMIVQRLARVRYFELSGAGTRISAFLGNQQIAEERALVLSDLHIRSLRELVNGLKELPDADYEKHVTHARNDIADWVLDVYKDEKLASKLRNTSRKGAIAVLEKELR